MIIMETIRCKLQNDVATNFLTIQNTLNGSSGHTLAENININIQMGNCIILPMERLLLKKDNLMWLITLLYPPFVLFQQLDKVFITQ